MQRIIGYCSGTFQNILWKSISFSQLNEFSSLNRPKKVGTHNGSFHTDEVMACLMLSKYTTEFENAIITRTRDQIILDQQDIVVDVGGIYDPANHRYDHHQKSFIDTFSDESQIRLSSAGLIYKHFGKEIIKNIVNSLIQEYKDKLIIEVSASEETIEMIYLRIYTQFIMSIDGIDNGINQYPLSVKPSYSNKTELNSRIGRLNPMWTEKNVDENARFRSAMEIADAELRHQVRNILMSIIPAKIEVQKSVQERYSVHPSGELVVLTTPVPWKEHLEEIERVLGIEQQIKFIIYPESETKQAWRIQAIPLNWGTFDQRVGLKEEWRGIKDGTKIKEISKIHDIIFVHNSGFIGGAKSYESTVLMGVESILAHQKQQNQ